MAALVLKSNVSVEGRGLGSWQCVLEGGWETISLAEVTGAQQGARRSILKPPGSPPSRRRRANKKRLLEL